VGRGVLGPGFPHRLQGIQFSGTAARGTKPAGLCLLLPMEQQEPWDLLKQVCRFPWHFRVKVAGIEGSMELQVPVCAWEGDLPPSNGVWSCVATSRLEDSEC
jgi:hypothetical protein